MVSLNTKISKETEVETLNSPLRYINSMGDHGHIAHPIILPLSYTGENPVNIPTDPEYNGQYKKV